MYIPVAEGAVAPSQEWFYQSDVSKLYRAIPFQQLAALVPKTKTEQSGKGCKPWLTTEGGIALLILKHYLCLSDALLIERVNTEGALQRFCGLALQSGETILDKDLPGRWRRYIGGYLDIDKWQLSLVSQWKADMQQTHMGFSDATVYESFITYRSDAKLLWKCCAQAFRLLNDMRKQAKLRRSRANHHKQKAAYLSFARLRKKSRRKNKKLCRRLLKYLDRLLTQIAAVRKKHPSLTLKNRQHNTLQTIEKIKQQQWRQYFGGQSQVPERMVSLHKPYLSAIVRGKENKPVEFGCKVNVLWVEGLCFIEHLSFHAFNESTRLKSTIALQRRYFGSCSQMGADALYATNENRRYCTEEGIATCFAAKGRQGRQAEQKAQMRAVLGRVRSTRLEGAFGREKLHYLLDKVKAPLQSTEVVWVFFGVLTSNAVTIAKRRCGSTARSKAA